MLGNSPKYSLSDMNEQVASALINAELQRLRHLPYSELINLTLVEAHTLSEWPKLDSLDGDTSATLGP